MVDFLSPEWIAALDAAVRADPGLATSTRGISVVVQQTVTGGGADGSDAVFHTVVDDGSVSVVAGPAADPTIWFSQDRATAWAIATGEASAQAAFMTGHLQVGGDLRVLVDNRLSTALADVFASTRTATTGPVGADDAGAT